MTVPALRLVDPPPQPAGPKSEPWMEQAACIGKNPSLFFDYEGNPAAVERARRICDACPVTEACLAHAMVNRIDHGMFGGYTEHERRRIRRGRPPIVAPKAKGRPAAKLSTGDRILAELRSGPLTALELQDRLGYRQNTIAHWTGVLRREGLITYTQQPGSRAWLYQLGGGVSE